MEQEKGHFPYSDKDCYVFTRTPLEDTEHVKFINEDIVNFTNNLKKEEGKDIWLVREVTVQSIPGAFHYSQLDVEFITSK